MERIARTMAAAIARAMADRIGGRGSQAKPSHYLHLAVAFWVVKESIHLTVTYPAAPLEWMGASPCQ